MPLDLKYIALTHEATGYCWMTEIKIFDNKEEALAHVIEKGQGVVFESNYVYKVN